MQKNDSQDKPMAPLLIPIGILLLIGAGISLHIAILASGVYGYIYMAEGVIGTIGIYGGIALLIVPLVIIGSVYTEKKDKITVIIVLLVLYIVAEILLAYIPGISTLGNGWGGMAILIVFGILRGVTFKNVKEGLDIPAKGYGNGFLNLYGWSFLVTTFLTFLLTIIGAATMSFTLLMIAAYIIIAQLYIDALSLGGIGISFIANAANKPRLATATAYTPAKPLGASEPAYQPVKAVQTEESVIKYCTYCGAQNFEGGNFCENCGKSLT